MSDPNDIYKSPEADLTNSKNVELASERKILKDFNNLFDDEDSYVRRKKMLANCFLLSAFVGIGILLFIYFQEIDLAWISLLLGIASGLLLGFGLWFISFVNNWPVIRQYVDKEKLQQRYSEIKLTK